MDQLDPERLGALWDAQNEDEETVEQSVIRFGLADETQIATAYAKHYLLPLFDPPADQPSPVDPAVAQRLPAQLCLNHLIAPLTDDGHTLEVAIASPDALRLADEIQYLSGRRMRAMFTPLSAIERLLGDMYEESQWSPDDYCFQRHHEPTSLESNTTSANAEEDDSEFHEFESLSEEAFAKAQTLDEQTQAYIHSLIEQALLAKATAIHLEPFEECCRVRIRVAGNFEERTAPAPSIQESVFDRLKSLAKMDIDQRHVPQDGTITVRAGERKIQIRMHTCPTLTSEKIVLQLQSKTPIPTSLRALGLEERQFKDLKAAIENPSGVVLVTGSQASGKANTLYACLQHLNDLENNIYTIEDSITQPCGGINQIQTRPEVGLTIPNALQSVLCQDPDVIMIEEIRDAETADRTLRAALGNHLMLSTLPTPDALSAIARLQELDVAPYLIASSLKLLISQRRLRTLCEECCQPYQLNREEYVRFGIQPGTILKRPAGCEHCQQTGYNGHLPMTEVIPVTNPLRRLIRRGASLQQLRRAVKANGTQLFDQISLQQVAAGVTSLQEALLRPI